MKEVDACSIQHLLGRSRITPGFGVNQESEGTASQISQGHDQPTQKIVVVSEPVPGDRHEDEGKSVKPVFCKKLTN